MYTSILAVLASMLVSALSDSSMDVAGLPQCAQQCLSNATTSQGSCNSVDIKCLCSNINYINALSCCLSQSCSTSDQQKALSFDTQLCNNVNVSIPNFVGCALSSGSSSGSGSAMSSASSSTATTMMAMTSGMGMMTMASGTAASTLNTVEVFYTISTGAPVARFTGGMLLEGTCTVPQIASITLGSGGTLEFPWLGCAAGAPNCCPWQGSQGGPLSICPMDYFTTANACCPSGWSIYTSGFAGQTPCYTSPPLPLVPPSQTGNPSALVSVISNQLFTLKYDLAPTKKGLPAGAKAGIAIGVIFGLAFLAFLTFCILRARKRKAAATAAAAVSGPYSDQRSTHGGDSSVAGDDRKSTTFSNPASTGPADYASELPSPSTRARSEKNLWIPSPPPQGPPPAMELPGSTYIHEHHPAYGAPDGYASGSAGASAPGEGYQHTSFNGNMPSQELGTEMPSIVISPTEGLRE